MAEKEKTKKGFPGQFWLVVLFEFFERGAYYGMMSFISVYFVNVLNFPKENVGVIKGVIQPLLYFLPIISGAMADRFGYRKVFMVAFTLLGGGYLLTSQATSYGAVFAALVIMGFGAGTFKPLITGTIAKITDEKNSTQGFGIYYWSINLGAFLFPLVLVPFLKAINPTYVIIASAICTGTMLIPTFFFFKDPVKLDKIQKKDQTSLIQTLANAFEIIYSPVVLLYYQMKKSSAGRIVFGLLLALLLIFSVNKYITKPSVTERFAAIGEVRENTTLIFQVDRNMLAADMHRFSGQEDDSSRFSVTVMKPDFIDAFAGELIKKMKPYPGFENVTQADIEDWIDKSDRKVILEFSRGTPSPDDFTFTQIADNHYHITLNNYDGYEGYKSDLLNEIHKTPLLAGITLSDCNNLYEDANGRSFFLLFVITVIVMGLFVTAVSRNRGAQKTEKGPVIQLPFLLVLAVGTLLWILPGLNLIGRIISSVIYLTVTSLFMIDKTNPDKFVDHAKFLLMIFLYSGFWVLYFQMFDSVLWYVQAYVDASSLNNVVNNFLGIFGIHINWFFDVEHVTVINAGTIILLQLLISMIVKKTKALPTMIFGIALGTIGMAILAINTTIWIFLAGMIIFSLGEMTAHPKFYSYIGLIAPRDKKAMYMGYVFLYGVFGSSIGSIIGARLYVHFVDGLNQPRTLWLIFACIGLFTIIALALYNKFIKPHSAKDK